MITLLSVMLIGLPKVLLPQLKIKVNAVHVGLSLPPVVLKVSAKSLMEIFKASPNNN